MGATEHQPAQTTRKQQPAGDRATPASQPTQPHAATQQGTPQGATPAPAAGAESTPRQRQENRREGPGTKTEQLAEPPKQPEAGRAVEKKPSEERNPALNKNQLREGTREEKPRKEESPSKQRGNQPEKQGGE
jgi:hypothetical protein